MKINKIAFAIVAALLAPAALAVPIAGLVNTGAGLSAGDQDSNYVLTAVNSSAASLNAGTHAGYVATDVHGAWLTPGSSSASQWLTPFENGNLSLDPDSAINGIYTWTLSFDLDIYFSAAYLTARWASDNYGLVYLNGQLLDQSDGYYAWDTFSASTDDFVAGTNVLSFVVTNFGQISGNPTGLRVEFTSSAVPEPESYALLLGSLGVLGAISRRRAK